MYIQGLVAIFHAYIEYKCSDGGLKSYQGALMLYSMCGWKIHVAVNPWIKTLKLESILCSDFVGFFPICLTLNLNIVMIRNKKEWGIVHTPKGRQ